MSTTEAPVRQETFYYPQRRFDRDVVDVFVIRYTWQGSALVNSEHLLPPDPKPWGSPGGWAEHHEGTVMEPALSIPGILAHMLATIPPYDAGPAECVVADLIAAALGQPPHPHRKEPS